MDPKTKTTSNPSRSIVVGTVRVSPLQSESFGAGFLATLPLSCTACYRALAPRYLALAPRYLPLAPRFRPLAPRYRSLAPCRMLQSRQKRHNSSRVMLHRTYFETRGRFRLFYLCCVFYCFNVFLRNKVCDSDINEISYPLQALC